MLRELLDALRTVPVATDSAAQIDQITLLEKLRSAVAAVQASVTAAFVAGVRSQRATAGIPAHRRDRGLAAQVGLARRISHHQAQRYVSWAMVLCNELPTTFDTLRAGETSEARAFTMTRETVFLSRTDRARVDDELGARLAGWGDRTVEAEVRRAAYRMDPHGFVERIPAAPRDRRVTVRPAPDGMGRVSALVPLPQAVASWNALRKHADTVIGTGDPERRTRGQVMADAFVERLTGQASARDVPVEVCLIMTDTALSGGDGTGVDENNWSADGTQEPAWLLDGGPLPAPLARRMITEPAHHVPRWVRRLYRHPETSQLITMDRDRRLFSPTQGHFVRLRDRRCRTAWCDSPIRHIDHVQPRATGGPTSVGNAGGRCEACNYAKQAVGWAAAPAGRPGQYLLTTPTGHTYLETTPDPPGAPPDGSRQRDRTMVR